MKRMVIAAALGAASLFALPMTAVAGAPSTLAAADVPALLAPPAHGARILAIWSLDCAYCEENLSALASYQRLHKDIELIFVATDPVTSQSALVARLRAAKLDGIPSRAYADATPDRINFSIDPEWGGETPRTVVIRADGRRKSLSGALDAQRIASLVD